jgi:hypothetical protein
MDAVAITIGVSWIITAFLLVGLSIPLVRGQVGRNALYGVRIRESLESDDAWFAINRFGGKRLIVWSIPLAMVGFASLFLPLQSNTGLALGLGFVPLIFVFIPAVEMVRFARRYRTK